MVLLHAGPGLDGSIFLPSAEALASDYRLLLVDLPGNGRSPDPEEWTFAAHARALEEFVASRARRVDAARPLVRRLRGHAAPRRLPGQRDAA